MPDGGVACMTGPHLSGQKTALPGMAGTCLACPDHPRGVVSGRSEAVRRVDDVAECACIRPDDRDEPGHDDSAVAVLEPTFAPKSLADETGRRCLEVPHRRAHLNSSLQFACEIMIYTPLKTRARRRSFERKESRMSFERRFHVT
jgi:hypothetical protein